MTPEQEKARAMFEAASRKVRAAPTVKAGGAGAESDYADAWDKMALQGLVPRLRGKYRRP